MGENWVSGQSGILEQHFQRVNVMDTTYESSRVNNLRDFRSRAYVNPSIVQCAAAYSNASCVAVPKKIHINPNFKGHGRFLQNKAAEPGAVHINPHFHRSKVNEQQQTFSLCNSLKGVVNVDEKTRIESNDMTLINKESQQLFNIVPEVYNPGYDSGCRQSKNTLCSAAISETRAPTNRLGKCGNNFGKTLDIKTRHKIIHANNLKPEAHSVNSYINSKRKLLNRYKLINVEGRGDIKSDGKSESVTDQRSVTYVPGGSRIPVSNIQDEGQSKSAENLKHIKLKHTFKRTSSVNRLTNSIKTKYIFPNRILWHKKRGTSLVRNSKHKLDKRKIAFEIIKTNAISPSQKKISKTVPSHKVKTLSCLWKSPSNKHKSQNHFIWRKREKKETAVKRMKKAYPNRTVVKIGGIMYKSSSNKLTRAREKKREVQTTNTTVSSKMRHHIVYVRGEKFLLDTSGKTLIRQPQLVDKSSSSTPIVRRIDLGGVTFIQKSSNVLIRTNTHEARQLVHSAKQRSIALLHHLRKRNNMPCMIYQRFGICRRYKKGMCIYVHDPKNIDLCKKFLKGECSRSDCPLSHEAVKEKMATCHFFLEGKCNKENCPYLHVKVNQKAVICRDFLQGFCNLGQNCTKRHIHQCPDYEEKGVCKRSTSCPYPHKKNAKRKTKSSKCYKITKLELTKTALPVKSEKIKGNFLDKSGSKIMKKNGLRSKCDNSKKRKMKMNQRQLDIPQAEEIGNQSVEECIPKRVKLPDLPLFIPLQSE